MLDIGPAICGHRGEVETVTPGNELALPWAQINLIAHACAHPLICLEAARLRLLAQGRRAERDIEEIAHSPSPSKEERIISSASSNSEESPVPRTMTSEPWRSITARRAAMRACPSPCPASRATRAKLRVSRSNMVVIRSEEHTSELQSLMR